MLKVTTLNIYYPYGILNCQDLKDAVCLHLLEHLICRNLSKIFKVNVFDDIKGSILPGYIRFVLKINEDNLGQLIDYFRNIEINVNKINKADFLCEKRRLKEEEYINRKDWRSQIEKPMLAKIFNKDLINYKSSEYLKALDKVKLDEAINLSQTFFDEKNFFIFSYQNDKPKVIKEIDKNFVLNDNFLSVRNIKK